MKNYNSINWTINQGVHMTLTFERFYYNNQDIHTKMVGEDPLILIVLAIEVNNTIDTYIPIQTEEMKM